MNKYKMGKYSFLLISLLFLSISIYSFTRIESKLNDFIDRYVPPIPSDAPPSNESMRFSGWIPAISGIRGSGTESDPYILENALFYGRADTFISIYMVTSFIIIRNCRFEGINNNNQIGMSIVDSQNVRIENCTFTKFRSAIELVRSQNITVFGNSMSGNSLGIYIRDSSEISLKNNVIGINFDIGVKCNAMTRSELRSNLIFYNFGSAELSLDTGSSNNLIQGNYFKPIKDAVFCSNDSRNNTFHRDVVGNYYGEPYREPYKINTYVGAVDLYPITIEDPRIPYSLLDTRSVSLQYILITVVPFFIYLFLYRVYLKSLEGKPARDFRAGEPTLWGLIFEEIVDRTFTVKDENNRMKYYSKTDVKILFAITISAIVMFSPIALAIFSKTVAYSYKYQIGWLGLIFSSIIVIFFIDVGIELMPNPLSFIVLYAFRSFIILTAGIFIQLLILCEPFPFYFGVISLYGFGLCFYFYLIARKMEYEYEMRLKKFKAEKQKKEKAKQTDHESEKNKNAEPESQKGQKQTGTTGTNKTTGTPIEELPSFILNDLLSKKKVKTPEEAADLIGKLQKAMDSRIASERYEEAYELSVKIDALHNKLKDMFEKLGFSDLRQKATIEQDKNLQIGFDLLNILNTAKYNSLSGYLEVLVKGMQTDAIIKQVSEILELLRSWKQAAQRVNNMDQIKRLDMLLEKYEDLYGFYSKIHGYDVLFQKFKMLSEQLSTQGCELKSDARKQWYGSYHSMLNECKKYVNETQGKHEEMHQKFKELLAKIEAIEEIKLKIDILYNYKVLEQRYNEFLNRIEKLDFARLKEDFFAFRRELFDFGILLRYHPLEPEFDKNIRKAYLKVKKGTKSLKKIINILNPAMEMKELDRLASEIIQKMKEETFFESVQALVELDNKLGTLKTKIETDYRYRKMVEFYATMYASIHEKMQKVIDFAKQKYAAVVSSAKEPNSFNLKTFKEAILKSGTVVDVSNTPIAKIDVSMKIQPDVIDFGIYTINFQPNIEIPIPKLPQAKIRTSVFSKVVVLGDSSVGKTHLILSMTDNQYSPVQGSTIGVEKYYKRVKVPNTNFDTQICFWDLGGQFNYRTINELFIRDASAVILVFDITRSETFDSLSYWIEIINHLKEPAFNNVILVGNKVDVGGSAIPKEKISAFIAEHELNRRYIETSAKTGYNLKELLELIVGMVDWAIPVQELDPNKLHSVSSILKALRNRVPIYEFDELIQQLKLYIPKADDLELKSMIQHYATQEALVISSKGTYILMEPEYIGKITAQCIEITAKSNGILNINAIQNWRYTRADLLKLFNYYVEERKCFKVEENTYAFSIVLHSPIPKLPAEIETVLKSAPIVRKYEFKGPTISIASYILNSFAFEFGKPALINNLGAVWQTGVGKQKTVCLLQFKPTITGGTLTIEAGGGESETIMGKIEEKIQFFFKAIFRAPFSRI